MNYRKKIQAQLNKKANQPTIINGKEVDMNSISLDGIDTRDYPDFVDAFIDSASFVDGTSLDGNELEELNDDNDLIYDCVINQLY